MTKNLSNPEKQYVFIDKNASIDCIGDDWRVTHSSPQTKLPKSVTVEVDGNEIEFCECADGYYRNL